MDGSTHDRVMMKKTIKINIIGIVMKHGQMKRNTIYLNSVRRYDDIGVWRTFADELRTRLST